MFSIRKNKQTHDYFLFQNTFLILQLDFSHLPSLQTRKPYVMLPQRGQHNTPSLYSVSGAFLPDSSKLLSHHLHIYVIFLASQLQIVSFVLYFLEVMSY
jgi:hypothetical protein